MSLNNKRIKNRKVKKGKLGKLECRKNSLRFGDFGLKAVESGSISDQQIKAATQILSQSIKKGGKIWIKIHPNIPITRKATGARMGKGTGTISHWNVKIKAGSVLFEVCLNAQKNEWIKSFKSCKEKLPIKTKIFR